MAPRVDYSKSFWCQYCGEAVKRADTKEWFLDKFNRVRHKTCRYQMRTVGKGKWTTKSRSDQRWRETGRVPW